jgi:PEP-CTERM motif
VNALNALWRCSAIFGIVCATGSATMAEASPILISNPGFETSESLNDGPPETFLNWSGDLASVVSAENGITPAEGTQMLRFLASRETFASGTISNMWQLIDMTSWSGQIADGTASVAFSAAFNRVTGDDTSEPQFAVVVRAFSGTPAEFPIVADGGLATSTTFLTSDANPATWQTITANLLLPVDTTYVGIHLGAIETLTFTNVLFDEFDGHYADLTQLSITGDDVTPLSTPEPASLMLMGSGLAALAARRRRRKVAR